jgi:hypothetical protein
MVKIKGNCRNAPCSRSKCIGLVDYLLKLADIDFLRETPDYFDDLFSAKLTEYSNGSPVIVCLF